MADLDLSIPGSDPLDGDSPSSSAPRTPTETEGRPSDATACANCGGMTPRDQQFVGSAHDCSAGPFACWDEAERAVDLYHERLGNGDTAQAAMKRVMTDFIRTRSGLPHRSEGE